MLLSLGMFVFESASIPFETLSHKQGWKHAESDRFGQRPVYQYLGPTGAVTKINGSLYPGQFGDYTSLDKLKTMAEDGDTYPLLDGEGRVWGSYHIEDVAENWSALDRVG